MDQIKGLGTALVTPFKNGEVDYNALERLIDFQISGGVDYLVTMGTTGESATLSPTEIQKVVRFTVKQVNNRCPIVMGMGGNNTRSLQEKMMAFDFDGITAILSASPAYNKPSQEGIFQHYEALNGITPLPIIVYNVPGRTSSNITAATTLRMAHELENIVAIKEASADLVQGAEIIGNKPENFVVLSGDDPTAMPLISLGGEGCISVISNAWPSQFSQVIDSAMNGDFETARRFHLDFLPLNKWLYIDGNPAGIKAALHIKGLIENELRLPLVPMAADHYNSLKSVMSNLAD